MQASVNDFCSYDVFRNSSRVGAAGIQMKERCEWIWKMHSFTMVGGEEAYIQLKFMIPATWYSLNLFFFSFWWYWDLNSGLRACWEEALPLEPCLQHCLLCLFLELKSHFLPRLTWTAIFLFYTSHHSCNVLPPITGGLPPHPEFFH
jgi:hypothetical protein